MSTPRDDITLELDRIRLALSPAVGGSIASLMVANARGRWAPVLRTMPSGSRDPSDAGSFVMLPWTNRIKDARFGFAGASYGLEPNFPDGTAIHGVGRDLPWRITDRSPITARLVLDSRAFPRDRINYPFAFGAVQRFEIGPDRVEIDLSVTNLDDRPIPVGCGHHPYIHRRLFSSADTLRVRLDVEGRYPARACIPVGDPADDEACALLRAPGPIGNPGLDDVFSGFEGRAVFDWAASGIRMTMECTGGLGHVVVYTPREPSGGPDEFVCVEPVTMVNDGFNLSDRGGSGTGVVVLGPEQSLRTRMTLSFSSGENPD